MTPALHAAFEQAALEGLTQAGLARELGLKRQNVNHWATGRYPVPIKHCRWLAKRLGLRLSDIRPDIWGDGW